MGIGDIVVCAKQRWEGFGVIYDTVPMGKPFIYRVYWINSGYRSDEFEWRIKLIFKGRRK
jgi:hypothetical protein